jgi:hypothetical protein
VLDYATATRLYSGRKDKYTGRKVRNRVYMLYYPERDCFVVSELWSKYENVPDPNRPGKTKFQKAPKERWDLRPFAEVYRDRIVITRALHNIPLYALFRVSSFKSRTVKLSGRTWTYRDNTLNTQQINGELPIMIKDDKLSSLTPPKVRVTDSEKRKEMNRMIRSVRNLLKVRTKLGAFDKITPAKLHEYVRLTTWAAKPSVLNNPAKFLELLQAVDPEDLKSFYPLLWLTDASWYFRNSNESFGRVDWVARYNNLVNRMRERMRRELGVVKYVETDERSADSPDGCVEADRTNELREV